MQSRSLIGLVVQSGNAILANTSYLYDGNHNRTRYRLNDGTASAPCSPWPATTTATAHFNVFKRLSTDFDEK